MKILVTGSAGFIGKNLIIELKNRGYSEIFEYDVNSDLSVLDEYCKQADFVFHLAGVNRPETEEEFMHGNFGFTSKLLNALKKYSNTCPIMISSSIQAALNNPYGISKKAGEDLLFDYSKSTGAKVYVYRFQNVFGKWCRPNYNSAVATFCNNIAGGLPINVNDPSVNMQLIYIDDLVNELISALNGSPNLKDDGFCHVEPVHKITLGEIVDLLYSFKRSREDLSVACMSDPFVKKLYATYLSYLPENEFGYFLKMNCDDRGSFTEILRTEHHGQFSVNISKPGITKGQHWHHTKNEKFVVVSGKGVIRFRKPDESKVIEYFVSGDKIQVIDIPTGYTHNIENLGDTDMVTFMWCNECFDPEHPDTYFLKV